MEFWLATLTNITTAIEKTVVADFSEYGLTHPALRYAIQFSPPVGSNSIARLEFGTNKTARYSSAGRMRILSIRLGAMNLAGCRGFRGNCATAASGVLTAATSSASPFINRARRENTCATRRRLDLCAGLSGAAVHQFFLAGGRGSPHRKTDRDLLGRHRRRSFRSFRISPGEPQPGIRSQTPERHRDASSIEFGGTVRSIVILTRRLCATDSGSYLNFRRTYTRISWSTTSLFRPRFGLSPAIMLSFFQRRGVRAARVAFRRCRITLWFAVLLVVAALAYLHLVGLPEFLKPPLLQMARDRGFDARFANARLAWGPAVYIENAGFSPTNRLAGPRLSAGLTEVKLNWAALLHWRLKADSAEVLNGMVKIPVSERYGKIISLDHVQVRLRLFSNDVAQLNDFRAVFRGIRIRIDGEVTNFASMADWKLPDRWQATKPDQTNASHPCRLPTFWSNFNSDRIRVWTSISPPMAATLTHFEPMQFL